MTGDQLYRDNLRLSQAEHEAQRIFLFSRPRCLGVVLSNACNIDCVHCYQAKNGDNLMLPAGIGQALRREFAGLYPFLSTLRLQGGELFSLPGFQELVDDVANTIDRPILSISTNGTLINEVWAEKIVRTPFATVTFSIDGGTPATYARLRRGAQLETVLENLQRIRDWKDKLRSDLPYIDSFFVVMRSNFREIPAYLEMMKRYGVLDVSLQTVEINAENAAREPSLEQDEVLREPEEVGELHSLLHETFAKYRGSFRMIRVSGLRTLFEQHGLESSFLLEEANGLYPDADAPGAPAAFDLCPNPWTTVFVAENGDVHLCFLSEPIGNLYEMPLAGIWNSPRALAKRSSMIAGRYVESGCSSYYCSWRDGKSAPPGGLVELKSLAAQVAREEEELPEDRGIKAVRRLLSAKNRRIAELETRFGQLSENNDGLHEKAQKYIEELEARLSASEAHGAHLKAKAAKAVADFEAIETELKRLQKRTISRIGWKVSQILSGFGIS